MSHLSRTAKTIVGMWIVVLLLLTASWATVFFDQKHWLFGVVLAITASCLSSFAATIHNRMNVARLCRLVRATKDLEPLDMPEPISLRVVAKSAPERL